MLNGLDRRVASEKLQSLPTLIEIADALYAPPDAPLGRAWLAYVFVSPAARRRGTGQTTLDAVLARARRDRARSLTVGGPPGNYVVSGVDIGDTETLEFFTRRGFTVGPRSIDLVVETSGANATDARVSLTDDIEVVKWISRNFSLSWAIEANRARLARGLYVARDGGTLLGFAAHSANLAALGTFGPVGVVPEVRGSGLGCALTAAALEGLATRGFETATVPWVAPETVGFYSRWRERSRVERVPLSRQLERGLVEADQS